MARICTNCHRLVPGRQDRCPKCGFVNTREDEPVGRQEEDAPEADVPSPAQEDDAGRGDDGQEGEQEDSQGEEAGEEDQGDQGRPVKVRKIGPAAGNGVTLADVDGLLTANG